MPHILVIHGPNLNLLGWRKPDIYGHLTLDEINDKIRQYASQHLLTVDIFQSNHEGELIDRIQQARGHTDGIVINPGGYTHTSVAIRDAIEAVEIPTIEVHLSNIQQREPFRRESMIAPACVGQISGLGWKSYLLALAYFHEQ